MPAATTPSDWRSSQLPQLTGLPLLPVGAGADGKAPIDTNTGLPMAGWKTASWAPDAIARADSNVVTAVGMRCGPDAGGLLCIDADGATALEALLAAGCDPDAAGWRISRPTAPDRLKLVFRVPEAQWPAPGSRRAGKVVIPTGPGEQLEIFWGKGQVVVAGLHRPSGALLEWIGGPASTTELPPAWLALWESAEPAAPAPAPPAAEIYHRPDAIALEALLPRDLESLARNGAGEGERNAALFKLAAAALAIQPAALSAGLLVDGTAESLVVAAAMRCSPPLAESEVLTILRSAESKPRALDPGWPERLRFHLNQQSKRTRDQQPPAARPGGGDAARPVIEPPPPSYMELIARCLSAIRQGNVDEEMEQKAELKTRFRVSDEQISTALFRRHAAEQLKRNTPTHDSVRLADVQPLEYLLDGWAPRGDLALTYGPFGTGKTTLAIAKLYAYATGNNLLDRSAAAPPGRGLFIATDSGAAALKKAILDIGIDPDNDPIFTPGHPEQRIWIWAHEPEQGHSAWICDIHGVIHLEQFIREKRISYVVIDSAKAVSSPAGWSYTCNESVKALLQYLREGLAQPTGACIEFLSHDGTEKGSHSGAKAWAEDPSMVCALSIARDEDNRRVGVTANFRKDRAAAIDPTRSLTFSLTNGQLVLQPGMEVVGSCEEALLQILWEAHQRGVESVGSKQLSDEAFARFKRTRKTVENTLARITGTGKGPRPTPVIRPRRGAYALSPAEIQKRTAAPNRTPPLTGGGTIRSIGASGICPPPYETPEGETGGNGNPRQTPTGELIGGAHSPVLASVLVEIPPERGGHPPKTTTDWVDAAVTALQLEPHQMHVREVMAWLKAHDAPTVTQTAVALALERLRKEDGEQSLFGAA